MIERLVDHLLSPGLGQLVVQVHLSRAEVFRCDKTGDREGLELARKLFAEAEARLEDARTGQQGLVALVHLLAATVASGDHGKASEIELALAGRLGGAEHAPPAEVEKALPESTASESLPGNGPETGTFTVLEIRPGKSAGTIRAYCQAADGAKHAVFAKSAAGQTLAGAVGKQVVVKYRQGDHGLIALGCSWRKPTWVPRLLLASGVAVLTRRRLSGTMLSLDRQSRKALE